MRKDADATLKRVASLGLLDRSRKVLEKGCYVEIPVTELRLRLRDGSSRECQNSTRERRIWPKPCKANCPRADLDLLPRGWYILGDVIVVKIHPDLVTISIPYRSGSSGLLSSLLHGITRLWHRGPVSGACARDDRRDQDGDGAS